MTLIINTNKEPKTQLSLKIYQCNDKSWRILSEDYINEWAYYKLRNLTTEEVLDEIRKLMII